jgi:hypothetical protein
VEPAVLGHGGRGDHGHRSCQWRRKLPGWQDFVGIITLLVMNSTISFIEENNAGNAAATLMGCLAPRAKRTQNRALLEQLAAIVNDDKGMNRLQQGG